MTAQENKDNTWNIWAKKVLSDIERMEEKLELLTAELAKCCSAIEVLKAQAVIIGGIGGTLSALAVSLIVRHLYG